VNSPNPTYEEEIESREEASTDDGPACRSNRIALAAPRDLKRRFPAL